MERIPTGVCRPPGEGRALRRVAHHALGGGSDGGAGGGATHVRGEEGACEASEEFSVGFGGLERAGRASLSVGCSCDVAAGAVPRRWAANKRPRIKHRAFTLGMRGVYVRKVPLPTARNGTRRLR